MVLTFLKSDDGKKEFFEEKKIYETEIVIDNPFGTK
jgi:hypothetical protein